MNFIKIPGQDFEMQTTQTTQREWRDVMGSNPSQFLGETLPVERVSFHDVEEYLKKLNTTQSEYDYRLPDEHQWELCCRAGSTTDYCFGDDVSKLGEYAWCWGNSEPKTHPVAEKKSNAWGFFDMHGNVWEWTSSLYSPEGSSRVLRGGSWSDGAQGLRSALRDGAHPGDRYDDVGFRLVRTLRNSKSSNALTLSESERAAVARKLIRQIRAKLSKLEGLL